MELFGSVGVPAVLTGRTLAFRSDEAPTKLIRRIGYLLLALDVDARRSLSERQMDELRLAVVREFEEDAEDVLLFFDGRDGEWRVKELLGPSTPREDNRQREAGILSALQKLRTSTVVHFHSGSGRFLRRLVQAGFDHCPLVGVEPSLLRANRSSEHLRDLCTIYHGSIIESTLALDADGLESLSKEFSLK